MVASTYGKKLIEVALPLDAIDMESAWAEAFPQVRCLRSACASILRRGHGRC